MWAQPKLAESANKPNHDLINILISLGFILLVLGDKLSNISAVFYRQLFLNTDTPWPRNCYPNYTVCSLN